MTISCLNSDKTLSFSGLEDLVPITKEMRGIADKMHFLGLDLLSACCFVYPVQESIYEHTIIVDIELKHQYPTMILDLPSGWKWYTQTATPDHWPLCAISYSETYVWLGFQSVEDRVQEIITGFEDYLSTKDKTALGAIMLLSDC